MSAWWDKALKRLRHHEDNTASSRAGQMPPIAPAQPASQAPRQPLSTPIRRATIGLDFGTSSTKCCFREERERKPYTLVAHDTPPEQTNRLLFPTSATVVNGRLLFGHKAEAAGTGQTIRSFKTCLLCQARAERPHFAKRAPFAKCTQCRAARPGWFRLGDYETSAEDLATLYLAVVLREGKARLLNVLDTEPAKVRINVNSAAPLDQMSEFGELEEYFQRAVFYAWQLADQGQNEWLLNDALAALEVAHRIPLPPVAESPTRVFPETHAAMTAYLLHPQSESGLYGLVDVGAGTTDVAFFWLQKNESETKAWYYAAGSKRVGMDDIDTALSSILTCRDGNLRAARETLSDRVVDTHRHLINPISRRMYQHQADILHRAMEVDQRDWAWRSKGTAHYRLFLVGGGASFLPVRELISKCPPVAASWDDQPSLLSLPSSTRIALPGGEILSLQQAREARTGSLLLLAYGLANPRPDIPKYDRDKDGVKRPSEENDLDSLKPDGHWW